MELSGSDSDRLREIAEACRHIVDELYNIPETWEIKFSHECVELPKTIRNVFDDIGFSVDKEIKKRENSRV